MNSQLKYTIDVEYGLIAYTDLLIFWTNGYLNIFPISAKYTVHSVHKSLDI